MLYWSCWDDLVIVLAAFNFVLVEFVTMMAEIAEITVTGTHFLQVGLCDTSWLDENDIIGCNS